MAQFTPRSGSVLGPSHHHHAPSRMIVIARLLVLALPLCLLAFGWYRAWAHDAESMWISVGLGLQTALTFLLFGIRQRYRQPLGSPVLILYLTALGLLWLGTGQFGSGDENFLRFAQAILLVVAMAVFALQVLADSGAPELRQANMLAQRLANRKDWPADLEQCRNLPEVKALREALRIDATPAFALLRHERAEVRIAALSALEFRRQWKPGQAELVLETAVNSKDAPVRAAAVTALANSADKRIIERMAQLLKDPSWEVRRAAAEALLWDTESRWSLLRDSVRAALMDPTFQDDGALLTNGQLLSAEAVKDLSSWITEKGILSDRSALTLGVHFGRALSDQPDQNLIEDLKKQLTDPHAPVILRMELAQLLQSGGLLDHDLQERLLDPLNPAPLRLMAAEALLTVGPHAGAVLALRDVARMPNREIALATADVVQRKLGVDLGLAVGQPLPNVNSRGAAEVTRKVMLWSTQTSHEPPN